MKRPGVRQTSVWVLLATGVVLLMRHWPQPIVTPPPIPVFRENSAPAPGVDSSPRKPLPLPVPLPLPRAIRRPSPTLMRAVVGETLSVSFTMYCLRTPTRRDHLPREGIIAADPRVFALDRDVDLILDGRPLGRFRVDDTGLLIKGRIIDIWVPDCQEARRFGRRRGKAVLVGRDTSPSPK